MPTTYTRTETFTREIVSYDVKHHRDAEWLKNHLRSVFSFAERMVRTFREELTDRILIYNEDDLHRVLREYVAHYNVNRVHAGLGFDAPKRRFGPKESGGRRRIRRKKVLDGLITTFEMAAA